MHSDDQRSARTNRARDVSGGLWRAVRHRGHRPFDALGGPESQVHSSRQEPRPVVSIRWPDISNDKFKDALLDAKYGIAFNNISFFLRLVAVLADFLATRFGGGMLPWAGGA
jgi:hypothetical protein